jgi:uncharacterized membrane protein
MDPLLVEILTVLADIIAMAGVILIFYAGLTAAILFVLREAKRRMEHSYRRIRHDFTHRLILGLDFLIAADLILTVARATIEEVLILALVVAIRIALTLSLIKEARDLEDWESGNQEVKEPPIRSY